MNPFERSAWLRKTVREMVLASPEGITRPEIAAKLSACLRSVGGHLAALQDEGVIGYVSACQRPFWISAEVVAQVAADMERNAKACWIKRRKESEKRRLARKREKTARTKPTQEQLVRNLSHLLLSYPDGVASGELARAAGIGRATASKRLQIGIALGVCSYTRVGNGIVLWCHPSNSSRLDEAKAENRRSVKARQLAASRAASRAKKVDVTDFERPSVQLCVKAHDAKPLLALGPSSVFDLGRMAA